MLFLSLLLIHKAMKISLKFTLFLAILPFAIASAANQYLYTDEIDNIKETQIVLHEGRHILVHTSENDVFAALNNGDGIVKIYKNGKKLYTLSYENNFIRPTSLYVAGNDIYLAGFTDNSLIEGSKIKTGIIWKNSEVLRELPNEITPFNAFSIYVSGDDIYTAGSEQTSVIIWKNGEKLYSMTNNEYYSDVQSLYVSNGSVYTAGCMGNAIVWKNEKELYRYDKQTSYAYSVYASDGDIYMAGFEVDRNNQATIWKNNKKLYTLSKKDSDARSVHIQGKDVYAAGFRWDKVGTGATAIIWKNGRELYELNDN